MLRLTVFYLTLTATTCFASERQKLIATIVEAGTFEWAGERFSVDIEGCELTHELSKKNKAGNWSFWSLISYQMNDVIFTNAHQSGRRLFTTLNRGTQDDPMMVGIATVRMRDGTTALRERHVSRKTLSETKPSPRGDGVSFYFQDTKRFSTLIQGPDAVSKAHRFTQGIKTYAERYCNFLS